MFHVLRLINLFCTVHITLVSSTFFSIHKTFQFQFSLSVTCSVAPFVAHPVAQCHLHIAQCVLCVLL
jgi:hypothetical protein